MPPLMHYICWFSLGTYTEVGFVPSDGGCHHEPDQTAWEMAEILRNAYGINLSAFIPVFDDVGLVNPALLPPPERCLEVMSETMIQEAKEADHYTIKDIFNQPKQIEGKAFADWLEAYRKRWKQGYFIVRLPG